MSKVNSDVQEAAQTTHFIYESILNLWAMTPIELKMYIMMMFVVSILLQYYKKSFLTRCSRTERIRKLWTFSFPIAVLLSVAGYFVYEGKIHYGYFILTGLTVSTVSMGVHRVAVDYVWPAIKMVVDAVWSRVMLIVRGKSKDA